MEEMGEYTTQLYRDYFKGILAAPPKTTPPVIRG